MAIMNGTRRITKLREGLKMARILQSPNPDPRPDSPAIHFISLYNFFHKPKPPRRAAYGLGIIGKFGGARRDRTVDLLNAIQREL